MSEILIAVFVAVVFFILGIVFSHLMHNRQFKKNQQMKVIYGVPRNIKNAKDIRNNKIDDILSMIENKIYQTLCFNSMEITKKGDEHVSLLDFQKAPPEIIDAWQQGKEYFDAYGLDVIRKDAERHEITAEFFELFRQKLKEVPLTFKGKYTGENPLPAPELELAKCLDSAPVSLGQLRGKVVLLNFWAMECETCILMLSEMEKLKEKYGDNGLEVISIHPPCKDDAPVTDFFSKHNYTFRKAIASFKTFITYHQAGAEIPTNFLINKSGFIVEGPIRELPDISVIEDLLNT